MSASLEKLLRDARLDLILARIEKDPKVIEEVIESLDSNIRSIRFNSIIVLGKLAEQSSSALSKLTACLEDNDWSICREAVRSIGNMGNIAEMAVSGLSKLNTNNEPSIRKEVAIALGKIGYGSEESKKSLLKALIDPNEDVRIEAAKSIGKIGFDSPETNLSLMNSLKDVSWRVRAASLTSFGEIENPTNEGISNLINALQDNDWRVRIRGINSLIKFGEQAVPQILGALKHKNIKVRIAAIEVLGEIKSDNPEVLKLLVKLLKNRKESIRGKTIDTLRNIGETSVPYFFSALESSSNGRRILLISGIGGIEGNLEGYLPKLIETLKTCKILKSKYELNISDRKLSVNEILKYNIKKIGTMIQSFVNDPFSKKTKIRVEISRALGKIGKGSDLAVDVLIEALTDIRNQVRRATALALGNHGSGASKAVPHLIKMLHDPNPDARWRASEALGRIGVDTAEVISGLEEILHDKYDHVSVSAEFAIDIIKTNT